MVFFDTNVLVYCTDASAPAKRQRALELVAEASAAGEAVISTQVLIELFHTLTREQRSSAPAAKKLCAAFLAWPVIGSDSALVEAAIDRCIASRLSIWDAMVVEAALRARAATLFTEDLTHGQRFGALRVVDPFRA